MDLLLATNEAHIYLNKRAFIMPPYGIIDWTTKKSCRRPLTCTHDLFCDYYTVGFPQLQTIGHNNICSSSVRAFSMQSMNAKIMLTPCSIYGICNLSATCAFFRGNRLHSLNATNGTHYYAVLLLHCFISKCEVFTGKSVDLR